MLRFIPAALLALALFPAAASAAPTISLGEDPIPNFWGQVGKEADLPNLYVSDIDACKDDRYDEANEEMIDPNQDDYLLVGAKVTLESLVGADWKPVSSSTITQDDFDDVGNIDCDGEGGGEVSYNISQSVITPAARTAYRTTVVGNGINFTSPEMKALPTFKTDYSWSPGPGNPKPKRKGYHTVDIKIDSRMIGQQVVMVLSTDGGKNFKAIKKATFKKKGSRGYTRLQFKTPKKSNWYGFVCVNYQKKFPSMGAGVACPTGKIAGSQLESLFPGSTRGYQ